MAVEDSVVLITSAYPDNRKFGTGFVIHTDADGDYVATCRHVAVDIGADTSRKVCLNYHEYPLLDLFMNTSGDPDDLAILKIRGPLTRPPLILRPAGSTGDKIRIYGYYRFSTNPDNHRQIPVNGELGERGVLHFRTRKGHMITSDLKIEEAEILQEGYSGSPVIREGTVAGVVSHRLREGRMGVAISIDLLFQLWPDIASRVIREMPENSERLSETLASNDSKNRPRPNEILTVGPEAVKSKVFISYAREDEKTARRLYDDLKKAGVEPWMDKVDLIPGQNWKIMLNQAIRGSDFFIALLSSKSVSKRGYVQKEFNYAFEVLDRIPPHEIFVIPVRLEACEIPYEKLGDIQWVDLFVDYEEGFKSILRGLGQAIVETDNNAEITIAEGLKEEIKENSENGAEIEREVRKPKMALEPPKKQAKKPAPGTIIAGPFGIKFAYIPTGSFLMGSPEDEPGRDSDESPQHTVRFKQGFYMQTTEVTQGQWKAVIGENPSYFKNCGDDCPVEQVSWEDAQTFIGKLNKKEGKALYRLPTEAEWEYAARAGTQTTFANGAIQELECGLDPNLDQMGWYCGNSEVSYEGCYDLTKYKGSKCAGSHPVATKQPNQWGLFDMHGNVWEWCEDDWHGDYKEAPDDGRAWIDEPNRGEARVVRGGSWRDYARDCRSASRYFSWPGYRLNFIGFRLTRSYP